VALGVTLVRPLSIEWLNAGLCLFIALALQIATNYANDYSDGVRGTDEVRVGPFRLTASKLVAAKSVRHAAWLGFLLASVAGLWLSSRTSWWLVLIGVSAVLAGWFYTGGPRPYGYFGFGELFVFVYFGLVATIGSTYAQHLTVPARSWWLGVAAGSMACALLEANNMRDIDGDQAAGKKTLAARLGRQRSAWLYAACVFGVVVGVIGSRDLVVAVVALALYAPALRTAFSEQHGRELLALLVRSARVQLLLGAILVVLLSLHWYWG
jgi:1,4-dihydroxy-2-naphthoate octaprenyltransferase